MNCNHRLFSGEFGRQGLEELDGILYQLDRDRLLQVRNLIDDYTAKKVKKVSRIQLVEIPAHCLRAGDIIFDLHKKNLSKIQYVSHYDSTWSKAAPNTVCISYGEDYDCDNLDIHGTAIIAIDLDKYVDLHCMNPELDEINTMNSRRNELYEFMENLAVDDKQYQEMKIQLDSYFGNYPIPKSNSQKEEES